MTDPTSIPARYSLEMITDAFEDALKERSFVGLAGAIDRLQDWRRDHGLTYQPFELPEPREPAAEKPAEVRVTTENDIDDAITSFVRTHQRTEIITSWIVLVGTSSVDEDGVENSGVETIMAGGSQPWPVALGLIEAARIRAHARFAS